MDPNETLADLRAIVAEVNAREDKGVAQNAQHVVDMSQLVEALDGWLSRGGFLPAAWQTNRVTGPTALDVTIGADRLQQSFPTLAQDFTRSGLEKLAAVALGVQL